jgi:ankyrin repeat protein
VFKANLEIAELLLEKGADVDGAGPDGRTALMMAAMFDRSEMVELLLSHGADVTRQDASGPTLPAIAAAFGAKATPGQIEQAMDAVAA